MTNRVDSICIVGGGTAGWMTAAYALHNLPNISITLVESPNIPTVGVGEATILGFDHFLKECGIPVALWSKACDATIKCGTYFPNWKGDGSNIWQPFYFPVGTSDDGAMGDIVTLALEAGATNEDLETYVSWYNSCIKQNLIPSNTSADGGDVHVGYHLDAIKLANFLSTYLNKKHPKLTHIKQHINNPVINNGNVQKVVLENGQEITADFFIDCTGFKKLLSNELPGADWVDRSHMLFTNAAVASQIDYETDDEPQVPYVTAQATDLGWIWKTPVKDRIGSGLCYNSNLTTKQEAEDHFVQHWGEHRLKTGKFNHVPFEPKYNRKNWRGNCFSVGLASGFIEPLESTGLALLIIGATGLSNLQKGHYTQDDVDTYNADIESVYEDSMNFVALHYFNNPRQGKFWKHVSENFKETDKLSELATTYAKTFTPTVENQFFPRNTEIFVEPNWKLWLQTVGIKPATPKIEKQNAINIIKAMHEVEHKQSAPGITNRQWSNR
jgi:flavin-dependent dehydrogenase